MVNSVKLEAIFVLTFLIFVKADKFHRLYHTLL